MKTTRTVFVVIAISALGGLLCASCGPEEDACQSLLGHIGDRVRACGADDAALGFCEDGCWNPLGCSSCSYTCDATFTQMAECLDKCLPLMDCTCLTQTPLLRCLGHEEWPWDKCVDVCLEPFYGQN